MTLLASFAVLCKGSLILAGIASIVTAAFFYADQDAKDEGWIGAGGALSLFSLFLFQAIALFAGAAWAVLRVSAYF